MTKLFRCVLALAGLCCVLASLADMHAFDCNFTVNADSARGQPWYTVQCSVDRISFFMFDNENKATPLGGLGNKTYSTESWTDLTGNLKHIGEELRKQLLDMKLQTDKTRNHHTLKGTMKSRCTQQQQGHASWNFTIDEKIILHFIASNQTWKEDHFENIYIMKQWETNRELVRDLRRFSVGDACHYLEKFLMHWKEMPRSTSPAPDITLHGSAALLSPQYIAVLVSMGVCILILN